MFDKKNKRRAAIWIGACLLIGSAGLGAGALPRTQGQANDIGYYYGLGDKKVELGFQPDRVGLLTRERVTRTQVAELASALGLKIERELSGGMFILTGKGLSTRGESIATARKLRTQYAKQVRDAGFVVAASDDQNPQVVTDDVLLRELRGADPKETAKLLDSLGMTIVKRLRGGMIRARVTEKSPFDALDGARYLKENKLARIAEPNRHFIAELFEQVPTDPFFSNQWHHRNTGASGGTVDADSDTSLAWDFTFGSANTVIAVVDNTFDLAHEDLSANVATNTLEVAGNGIDDDGNGYIDDVTGWDFVSDDNNPGPVNVRDNHGTAVTGVAVAAANNGVGVSGACPSCRFIPLTIFNNCVGLTCASSVAGFAEAIDYATWSSAQIINNSWGKTNPAAAADAIVVDAIDDATAAGKIVVFSGGNSPSSAYCNAGYPSLGNVIAVSSSSNLDRKVNGHAFGNCI
ncbi:MAG TPA: S8 family serine peptidase, partial [Polyangiales bacterium]|nr:S8 family serine peptidase [Polyangiales bacterium]